VPRWRSAINAQSGVCRGERIVNSISSEREAGGKARSDRGAQRWRAILSEHPAITSIMLACTVIGAVLGCILLSEDWPRARRVLGGAVGGAGCGLLITATRMIG
jgi:hypothetical protein